MGLLFSSVILRSMPVPRGASPKSRVSRGGGIPIVPVSITNICAGYVLVKPMVAPLHTTRRATTTPRAMSCQRARAGQRRHGVGEGVEAPLADRGRQLQLVAALWRALAEGTGPKVLDLLLLGHV